MSLHYVKNKVQKQQHFLKSTFPFLYKEWTDGCVIKKLIRARFALNWHCVQNLNNCEGDKILKNLHCRFDCYYIGQIYGGDLAKICSLLRIYELYQHFSFRNYFFPLFTVHSSRVVLTLARLFIVKNFNFQSCKDANKCFSKEDSLRWYAWEKTLFTKVQILNQTCHHK